MKTPTFPKTRKFVKDHKTGILITALVTVTTIAWIQHEGIKDLNGFLDAEGLTDKYYTEEED